MIVYPQLTTLLNGSSVRKPSSSWSLLLHASTAPTTAMTHIAVQEQLDGKVVDWLEKVSDEQYQEGLPPK